MPNTNKYIIPNLISPNIFRAYDIRGVVNDTLTAEIVYAIGRAFGSEAQKINEKTVIIARDGRLSGPQLIAALQQGLIDSGCDVIDIGIVPTPILYFATHILPARSGIMLTGSHNPPEYNGLKMILAGKTLADQDIQKLYQRILQQEFVSGAGQAQQININDQYSQRICQDIKLSRPLKIVVDAGNGVAGPIATQLFRALNCEVIELFCDIDGKFPNHHPDPSDEKNLINLIDAVANHHADLGIAFDGDGDRLGIVTNEGEIICPDRLLLLFAKDILQRHKNAEIIFDVKCSRHLTSFINQNGGKPIMWKTGHSLIKAKMQETGALLAGEMSGHIFFKERWYGFDDGIYAAARLLEIFAAQRRTSNDLFNTLPDSINTPELKLAVSDEKKWTLLELLKKHAFFINADINVIDGIRVDYEDGWGLIRVSNTTPNLILRFEADSYAGLERIQKIFRQQLLNIDGDLKLPF
jgi:phosphomannomutase/phosphoglucomutase